MNEIIKSALNEARTAAEEALTAAREGRFAEARQLLAIMEDALTRCESGNGAVRQSRAKTLRIEAEVRGLFDAAGETVEAPAAAASEVEQEPAPVAALTVEVSEPTPVQEVPAAAPVRKTAPPLAYTAEQWERVRVALVASGEDADAREQEAQAFAAQRAEARLAKNTFRAKVLEGQELQARVEVAAMRGDVVAANAAWDRLFDVVTAIRSMEGTHRRKNGGQADPQKAADYDAAREGRLKISQWVQGKGLQVPA